MILEIEGLSKRIGLVPHFPMTMIVEPEQGHAAMHAVGDEIKKLERNYAQ